MIKQLLICEGCCPSGENCRGLDPGCPVLPPPIQWRLVGRRTICTPGIPIAWGV